MRVRPARLRVPRRFAKTTVRRGASQGILGISSFFPFYWGFNFIAISAAVSVSVWQRMWILETFGWGLAIGVPFLLVTGMALRTDPRLLFIHWRRWLAVGFLGAAAWALLGFHHTWTEVFERESLGGQAGRFLLAGGGAGGVGLVVLYLLAGSILLAPGFALRLSRRSGRGLRQAVVAAGTTMYASGKKARFFANGGLLWLKRGTIKVAQGVPHRRIFTLTDTSPTVPPARAQEPNYDNEDLERDVSDIPEHLQVRLNEVWSPPLQNSLNELWPPGTRNQEKPEEGRSARANNDKDLAMALERAAVRLKPNGWKLPPLEVLDEVPEARVSEAEREKKAQTIEETLGSFGVEVKVVEINPGPAVTQFGVEPGWIKRTKEVKERDRAGQLKLDRDGNPVVKRVEVARSRVKVDSILNLEKDLALALAAPIRMEAPVVGKSMVGIEVPNSKLGLVGLREVLESPQFQRVSTKTKLAIALGKGTGGEPVVFDLAKMPHLLVAGATGSGKSVSLSAMLYCLLMQCTPEELRLILVDPKRVELQVFDGVPHLRLPVITETDKVLAVLRWASEEMDSRYKQLQAAGARNIENYNRLHKGKDFMPFLIIAIDEMADLMVTAPVDIEHSVTRLAQLGRAAGIHLLVATQRPSVDVITGLIKANFPARVSFNVTSVVDSRTILDSGGAEKLLGRGDMLFLPPDAPKPKRLQGCFISEREMGLVTRFWREQRASGHPQQLTDEEVMDKLVGVSSAKKDPLLEKARQLAHTHSQISTSLLQRRLGVGYPRAAKLMEHMEEEGLVAPRGKGESRETVVPAVEVDEGGDT